MHMTFGRLGAVDAAAKMSGMEGALPATWRLPRNRWTRYQLALAVAVGVGIAMTYIALQGPLWFQDVDSYWSAALRIRSGHELFPAALDRPDSMYIGAVYRYAPWFAWAWVPLTYLPREIVTALWALALFASVAYVGWSIRGRWIVFALLMPFLFDSATDGNVQPLLVAGLVYGLTRHSGPMWIALAASLKAAPLAFVLVYVGRREWNKAAVTLLLTVALTAPILFFDLSHYPDNPGGRVLFYGSLLYPLVVAILIGVTLGLAQTRWAWLAAGATAVAVMPRFWFYDLTWLISGSTHQRKQVWAAGVATNPIADDDRRGATVDGADRQEHVVHQRARG
jgi:hypothetical protein